MSEDTEKEETTQDITIESLIAKTDEILDEFEDPRSIITELRTALKAAQKDAADALIDATRAELDPVKRGEIYEELQVRLAELKPWVYLYDTTVYDGINTNKVAEIDVNGSQIQSYYEVKMVK